MSQAISDSGPEQARESAKPVIGYFCSYVPPELFLAAGLYPLRLRGAGIEDSSSGDAYMSHLTCSFARHVAAAVLDGEYDFLAGQVSVNTCDHVRRANDVIVAKSDLAFHGYLSAPRSFRESLEPWYLEELGRLKAALEEHFAATITDQALADAIRSTNRVRESLLALEELRRADPPLLSGADVLTAGVAARVLPPEDFSELATELARAAGEGNPIEGIRARVVMMGGELDDPRFVRTIESQGAHVAGDLICYGARGLGNMVEESGPPLEELARAYLHQVPCARMMGEFPRRYRELRELIEKVGARGLVFQRIKFCQIWSNEVHNLMHRFEREPFPMLVLDREYGTVSTGQIKTRVQAFLEKLGA